MEDGRMPRCLVLVGPGTGEEARTGKAAAATTPALESLGAD